MAKDQSDKMHPFADTVTGKILIGVAVAAGSAFISWFASRATYVAPPPLKPIARIVPTEAVVQANTVIEFSAAGSVFHDTDRPSYVWRVSGLEPNVSPAARCSGVETILSCRFIVPGTFAVSVEVIDANGQSSMSASSITVSVPNGYLGLILRGGRRDSLKALLYDIDWAALQPLTRGRLIILEDPETGAPVYAALAEPPTTATSPPAWRGAAAGLKIAIPPMSANARIAFETALIEIGLVPVTLPFAEIFSATEQGMTDVGFVMIDSPGALTDVLHKP